MPVTTEDMGNSLRIIKEFIDKGTTTYDDDTLEFAIDVRSFANIAYEIHRRMDVAECFTKCPEVWSKLNKDFTDAEREQGEVNTRVRMLSFMIGIKDILLDTHTSTEMRFVLIAGMVHYFWLCYNTLPLPTRGKDVPKAVTDREIGELTVAIMILLPDDDESDDDDDAETETDAGDDANVPDADDADDSTTTLVMVQDIDGRSKHVMADLDTWDVNDVLQSLGYPTDVDLRIMFAGKQLVPGSSLASNGIEPQSVPLHRGPAILKLIGRAHGGSQRVAEKKNRLRNEKAVRERLMLEGDTTLTSEEISTMMAERGCVEGGRLGWAFNPKQIEMKDRLLKKLAWRRTTPSSVGEAASSSGAAAAAVYEKQNKKKMDEMLAEGKKNAEKLQGRK